MTLIEPLVFPFDHDWSVPFGEEQEFLTTIQTLDNETEQRSALIIMPQRRFLQHLKVMDQTEYAMLRARLWGGLGKIWWVPYWPRQIYLAANLSIGATSIALNGEELEAVVGQGVMLFRSSEYVEVVTVSAVSDSSITVAALTKTWRGASQRDTIVPVYRGIMLLKQSLNFLDVDLAEGGVTFQLEPGL